MRPAVKTQLAHKLMLIFVKMQISALLKDCNLSQLTRFNPQFSQLRIE